MNPKSVLVIGAGIGGIVAATHLARRGLNVTVVEKNSRPGGRCNRIIRDGHRFDTGPTLLVMPLLYESEFRALGAEMHGLLNLQRVDPTYTLVFDDGSKLKLTSDIKSMQAQLEAIEPGSFPGFLRYLQEGSRNYTVGIEKLVNHDFRTAFDLINIGNVPLLFRLKPLVRHYKNMSSYFRDPRLKAAFTFQDVYMGLSPFEAPSTFSLMPFSELTHGVWHPQGGMYRIVEALMELARAAGVTFVFNTPVAQIDLDVDHDSARGVSVPGGHLQADILVANADLPYVYQTLLPADDTSKNLARKHFSCSAISFFWGVDKTYHALQPHTLFLADDYRENFESLNQDDGLPANPSLYVHAPARLDASMSPPGHDTLTAVVPVGHLSDRDAQDWGQIRDQARQQVLRRLRTLGIDDLESHIKFEMSFTPLSWRKRYNLVKGATHGLSHTLTQLAYFRPHNRHARYRNLYFVGASTHPGTGLPTAMVSGRLVADRIMDDLT